MRPWGGVYANGTCGAEGVAATKKARLALGLAPLIGIKLSTSTCEPSAVRCGRLSRDAGAARPLPDGIIAVTAGS